METIDPARPDGGDGTTGSAVATTTAPAERAAAPPDGPPGKGTATVGLGGIAVVLAVIALVFASVAAFVGDDDDGGGTAGGGAGPVTVSLSEFAIDPAAITVPAGGELTVTNDGAVAHNLSITGADIATADLGAGESETLDLSALEPGDYDVLCTIPGHADSGMKGTLTIGGDSSEGGLGTGSGSSGDSSGASGAHDMSAMSDEQYAEMSRAMDESISAFPAETEGAGNQELEAKVAPDGTKVFALEAEVVDWEVEPGTTVQAWAYNGMVPGPQIHVEVGDKVRIELTNNLPMATDLHLHGINVPNDMDGVAPITQDKIEPGDTFDYEFTADEPAVAMYHAHHGGQKQVPDGLLGTVFVGDMALPRGRTISGHEIPTDLRVSQELPLVLNDSGVIGYSLNGKSFPATAPIVADKGEWVLVHYFNEGGQIHPMHLHQFDQVVVAKDGFPLDEPYVADTVNVAPGERYSVLVKMDEPGTWVWHCHILNHVERESGMYGMVTAVVVQ